MAQQPSWEESSKNRRILLSIAIYAMGIEAMRELLSSDRINGYTTIGRQEAKDNITTWTTDYTTALLIHLLKW